MKPIRPGSRNDRVRNPPSRDSRLERVADGVGDEGHMRSPGDDAVVPGDHKTTIRACTVELGMREWERIVVDEEGSGSFGSQETLRHGEVVLPESRLREEVGTKGPLDVVDG